MHRFALALVCLAFTAQGRRLQNAEEHMLDGAKSLASILQAFNPAMRPKPALVPLKPQVSRRQVSMKPQSNFVADMQRRTIMNLLTLGAVSVPVGWILFIFISYFIPPNEGGAGGAVTALDAVGGAITFEGWLKDNLPETRKLVQGIRGDATYLIVNKDRKIEDFGVNAVCTHLGCVVPWNRAQNKFMCPCHGSQYDYSGKVVRGPAPLSLALAHVVDTGNGKVSFTPWTEQDFRTGQDPWWKP